MRDTMKACQHTLTDDVIFKEVVVVGNGPSGMVTSYMLAGNVPYLKQVPEDLPIDDMLRARLSNLVPGQSLYEVDLMELAEGLEGRSHNPIPLLMDSLLRPCADLGIQADSLIEWKFDIDKQIDHIVLGRGPPGGTWHSIPPSVRTLSPGAWLALPPHASAGGGAGAGAERLSARAVAQYCRRYVHTCGLQRYFRCGVVVSSVTVLARTAAPACDNRACPLQANFCVAGYDRSQCRPVRYFCRRVVLCAGGADRPNSVRARLAARPVHDLAEHERAVRLLQADESPPPVLVLGSGVSAADAVRACARAGLRTVHVHRAPAPALARLPATAYPDYYKIYQMMRDGPSGNHPDYSPLPSHAVLDVSPLPARPHPRHEDLDDALCPKRVTLLNLVTNKTEQITVSLVTILVGAKPDLFFLQTNFDLNFEPKKCTKCDPKNQRQCFLKNHWHYLKSMVGQSIQSCKSRYLNYTEINGNTETKCAEPNCNKTEKCTLCLNKVENGTNDKCPVISYTDEDKCTCEQNPYSAGIGFGIDPKKPVDGRSNPIAIDKSTHELLNSPKGLYALGPLSGDNFVRFIPGGALAIVSSIHRENKM